MASSSSLRRRSVERDPLGQSIEMKGSFKVSEMSDDKRNIDYETPMYGGDGEQWGDTENDLRDMERLGKKQEFKLSGRRHTMAQKRNFNFLSALGFVSIYMATWEFVLVSLSVGLANGGFAGLFWCGSSFIVTEDNTTGSEFAPPEYQRILSYASGWMSTLGWIAGVAGSVFVCTSQINAIINVTAPDYAFSNWQYTLIIVAFILLTIVFNTIGAKTLPALETLSLFGHLAGFLVVLVPLWVLCPKNSANEVFVDYQTNGGYSAGPAFLISQVTILYCNLGSDSVVHISEEVEDASITVPRCMMYSFVMNIGLGIIMLITMLFCIGPLDAVIESDVPYLILFNRTGIPGLSVALNVILFVLIYAGNITALATCAREMFAFARDKGLPWSGWIGEMNRQWNVPFNSVYATSIVCLLLSLINLGSTVAFNTVVSVSVLGLLSTYMISIGCVLLKRIKGEPLPPARWSLGRCGIWINGFAFFYSAFIIVFSCFPSYLPVSTADANWAPLVWFAVIIISGVMYVFHGKRHYTAPVEFVEGRKSAGVGLQSS
ncbi:hypothetical protein LTR08_004722 [Meristemomyces frigidus]|nr:hypothetical protein LTR08_004722 [Meristemomyces frigidus]